MKLAFLVDMEDPRTIPTLFVGLSHLGKSSQRFFFCGNSINICNIIAEKSVEITFFSTNCMWVSAIVHLEPGLGVRAWSSLSADSSSASPQDVTLTLFHPVIPQFYRNCPCAVHIWTDEYGTGIPIKGFRTKDVKFLISLKSGFTLNFSQNMGGMFI